MRPLRTRARGNRVSEPILTIGRLVLSLFSTPIMNQLRPGAATQIA
jgi:hypothetical protein